MKYQEIGRTDILSIKGKNTHNIIICKSDIRHIKIWWYIRKLKKNFKDLEKNKTNNILIKYYKFGIESIQGNFIKEIRKQKLKKIT